jgi:hypothetical protein
MTITYQLRTLIAETLLKLALRIMPPGMESGSLEAALRQYGRETLAAREFAAKLPF